MRRALPLAGLSSAVFLLSSFSLFAQNDRFAYAITDLTKDGMGWNALRKLDLQTGQYSDVLINGTDTKRIAFDAVSKKRNKAANRCPLGRSAAGAVCYRRCRSCI